MNMVHVEEFGFVHTKKPTVAAVRAVMVFTPLFYCINYSFSVSFMMLCCIIFKPVVLFFFVFYCCGVNLCLSGAVATNWPFIAHLDQGGPTSFFAEARNICHIGAQGQETVPGTKLINK
jgi:hypothetical protein